MMRYLLLSVLVVSLVGCMFIPNALGDEIFDREKTDILQSLAINNWFPYNFELERDFTKEQGITESNYQLYKLIDSKTTKRVGDLRFYLGSSEWWDENAFLQEDDTSGFENIFKVKIFLMHKTEPAVAQQMANHSSTALQILFPEWSSEIDDVLDDWFIDSINFSKRNEQNKRENSIMTENKEIKVFHDDLEYGSITVIVTENADTIFLGSVSTALERDFTKEQGPEDIMVPEQGGGCLIATATFGSEMAPRVQFLRELRDNTVLQTEYGTSFMTGFNQFYYSFSPYIADYERENPAFKETVKLALTPLLTSLILLQYVDIDSESEMLGYGIGVILLNIGMYFVAPAVLIMTIRKRI